MQQILMSVLYLISTGLALGDSQPPVTRPDHKEVEYEGKPISEWISAFKEGDPFARIHAGKVLTCLGKQAVPALIHALKDDNAKIREEVAMVLTALESQASEAVPALIEALKDREPGVREAAACALSKIGSAAKAAVPALTEALRDGKTRVQVGAALALSTLDPDRTPAMVNHLIQALEDGDARSSAMVALEAIGPLARAAAPQLGDFLQKAPNKWDRAFAARSLAKVDPSPKTISLLIGALKDKDVCVRIYAAHGLHDIGPSAAAAIDPLIESLREDDKNLRARSAWALGAIGSKARAAIIPLTSALNDADPEVRNRAAYALARIDQERTPAMVNRLLAALKDKDIEVRADAAFSLGEIGSSAKEALSQLIEALMDKAEVRLNANAAIKKISAANRQGKRKGVGTRN